MFMIVQAGQAGLLTVRVCQTIEGNDHGGDAQAAAGEGGDLLPGVCALVEAWLGDVALAGLRGAPPSGPLLGAWFDDRRVALDLKVPHLDASKTKKHTRANACEHSCLPIAASAHIASGAGLTVFMWTASASA